MKEKLRKSAMKAGAQGLGKAPADRMGNMTLPLEDHAEVVEGPGFSFQVMKRRSAVP
jgi:hypothetical protein